MRKYLPIIGNIIGIAFGVIVTLFGIFWIIITIVDKYDDERTIGAVMGIVSIIIGGSIVAGMIINIKRRLKSKYNQPSENQ